MGVRIKKVLILLLVMGFLGGLTEYFGPTMDVDEKGILNVEESMEAASLAPVISAEGAVLVMGENAKVVYEKDADKKLYPASTTKIMTALVTLEIMEEINASMDSIITVPKEAIGIEGSSVYLKEGEVVTVEELLYGAMLQSGNDAATALAISFGGTEEKFIERMNQKAKEIGCTCTKFVNPTGLFDENHFTTARDLALISTQAMRNDIFREIVASEEWTSEKNGKTFVNKNKTIKEYDGATGVKIGYTKKSGRTLVSSAKKNDIELIAVLLNDPNWFQDAYSMLDYGFRTMTGEVKGES